MDKLATLFVALLGLLSFSASAFADGVELESFSAPAAPRAAAPAPKLEDWSNHLANMAVQVESRGGHVKYQHPKTGCMVFTVSEFPLGVAFSAEDAAVTPYHTPAENLHKCRVINPASDEETLATTRWIEHSGAFAGEALQCVALVKFRKEDGKKLARVELAPLAVMSSECSGKDEVFPESEILTREFMIPEGNVNFVPRHANLVVGGNAKELVREDSLDRYRVIGGKAVPTPTQTATTASATEGNFDSAWSWLLIAISFVLFTYFAWNRFGRTRLWAWAIGGAVMAGGISFFSPVLALIAAAIFAAVTIRF